MNIQQQFILRYRAEGHVRFAVPALFCESQHALALEQALAKIDGVYRVSLFRSQKKLAIRYHEHYCSFQQLARALWQIIADLERHRLQEEQSLAAKKARLQKSLKERLKQLKVSRWFQQRYEDAKETVQAAKIVTKVGIKRNRALLKDPEKAIIDFLNDILVLFLIRLHWEHITKEWIPHPLKYRNEWAAVFYMIFLLMRSRRPKP